MPVVNVNKDEFFKMMGRSYTEEELDQLCFAYGLEYDGETSQRKMIAKEHGVDINSADANASEETLIRIEVAANRYDLLSVEGLIMSLRTFIDPAANPFPHFTAQPPTTHITVKPEVESVRSIIVCAIIRNVEFTERSFLSFIDMQDKLHQTLCKRRILASIGTHDLDKVACPFTYEARVPSDIHFCPLRGTEGRVVDGAECMRALEADLALRDYLPIIRECERYPVVYDAKGEVMSLPPIINGSYSKMSVDTKNVFIEVTATDFTKANIVLNTVACLFSAYATPKYTIEQVEVRRPDGTTLVTPCLDYRVQEGSVSELNTALGLNLTAEQQLGYMHKMGHEGKVKDKDTILVEISPLRSDILHECDLVEDLAIAYGFNNLEMAMPPTPTIGHQLVRTKVAELLSYELSMAGFTEVLTWALCSNADNYANLNRPDDGKSVKIANSKSADFQAGRVALLTGLLRCVASNKAVPLPIRVFEVGDVILKDESYAVGTKNSQHICAVYCGMTSGFEFIHSLLDRVMADLGVPPAIAKAQAEEAQKKKGILPYSLKAASDPAFLPGLCAEVFVGEVKIGVIGVVHPSVLERMGIDNPCSAFEISLEFPYGI